MVPSNTNLLQIS